MNEEYSSFAQFSSKKQHHPDSNINVDGYALIDGLEGQGEWGKIVKWKVTYISHDFQASMSSPRSLWCLDCKRMGYKPGCLVKFDALTTTSEVNLEAACQNRTLFVGQDSFRKLICSHSK